MFAAQIRRKQVQQIWPFTRRRRHLDAFCAKIDREMHCLWRSVDQEGEVLDAFVTKTRGKGSVLKFINKLATRYG